MSSGLPALEALACGLPVVSSRVGAEGLCLRPGEHYTLAEEDGMGSALVQGFYFARPALPLTAGGSAIVHTETYATNRKEQA